MEGYSLLKNSLYARFDPRSSPKHTVFEASWSLPSLMRSHCELSADFFNRLVNSANFVLTAFYEVRSQQPPPAPNSPPQRLASSTSYVPLVELTLELVAIVVVRRPPGNGSPFRSQHVTAARRVSRIEHHAL